MNSESEQPSQPAHPRRPRWPFVVVAGIGGAAVCSFLWYRFMTAPLPPGESDESSALGNMIVWIVIIISVSVGAAVAASLGWLLGSLVDALLPLSHESKNA